MSKSRSLSSRIDAEFAAVEKEIKNIQMEGLREYQERRARLKRLDDVFRDLAEVWKPRLKTLLQMFGDRVEVTPLLTPTAREATFAFASELGQIRLRFSVSTDPEIHQVILGRDLEIIPNYFRFEPHAELVFPLSAVDEEAAGRWVDNRIIDFVRTYISMGESEAYLRQHTVEDPVAHVRFPDFAAGATLEWQGQKYYFIGEETRQEFEKTAAAKEGRGPGRGPYEIEEASMQQVSSVDVREVAPADSI
jgi:YHS domain-containing protein